MRVFAVVGVCLIGGIAWAISLSFAPAAKPAVTFSQALPPAAAEPAAKPAEMPVVQSAWPKAKPAEQPVAEAAVQTDAKAVDPPAAESDLISGEQLTAEIKAAAEAKPVEPAAGQAAAQSDVTGSTDKPIVQAALQPDVKSDEATAAPPAPPAAQPSPAPAEAPAAAAAPQAAKDCPGNPDALGTSRVLTINPNEYNLLGTINYKQTLPLKDHEVVLTFDDGPIPPYTTSVLDTLAANCVKATYFLVGEMAAPRPYLVRRIYNEGHSIGTHSQHHPFAFQRLSMARVEREVDGGIASVNSALGDPKALSPFFRIPGFGRTNAIDSYLESKGLITWSADVDTDDWWRGTTPGALIQRTMRRLNERGRGIILMHDIHPSTALALPALLKELKANGYHVVHVVFAGEQPKSLPEVVATPLEKENWPRVMHADAEKGGPAKTALRHRVKLALAHHHRRVAERKEAGQIDYTTTSSLDRG